MSRRRPTFCLSPSSAVHHDLPCVVLVACYAYIPALVIRPQGSVYYQWPYVRTKPMFGHCENSPNTGLFCSIQKSINTLLSMCAVVWLQLWQRDVKRGGGRFGHFGGRGCPNIGPARQTTTFPPFILLEIYMDM